MGLTRDILSPMAIPVLHPTNVTDGEGPGLRYRIEGELVPVLHLTINQMPIYFEHHVILWKQPQIDIAMHPMKKGFKRFLAGLPIFMTEARGTGEVAFSRDTPGHLIPMHLGPGESIIVREHQFLAATASVQYDAERIRGIGSMLFGNQGFWQDVFTGDREGGIVWLHGHGNVFDVTLAPGEIIDVEPGAWVYRDRSVGYQQQMFGLKTGLLGGGGNLVFNRFTGPGRVGIQSGFYGMGESGAVSGGDTAVKMGGAAVMGGILGGILGD